MDVPVKMTSTYAGPRGCARPGQTISVSAEEAKELVAGGFAEAVETAQAPGDVETAKAPKAGKREKRAGAGQK